MKLYGRTLLFFLGAIIFQALLTAGLIIGLVSRNNQTVTRVELREESDVVYSNYNNWVRTMWKSVITIRDDEDLVLLAAEAEDWIDENRLADEIETALYASGMDSFVLRHQGNDQFHILADAYPYIDDFSPFVVDRNHPYISLKTIEGYTFLVASVTLGSEVELFLLKHIDDDFYNQLKSRDHTRIFVSSDKDSMSNAVGTGDDIAEFIDLEENYPPYRELYDRNFGRGHYNVSIRNIGQLEGNGELKLLVFMSVEPYFSLLVRIGRIVLLVSVITAVLTAIVAILFTGRLSRPVQKLARATREVREGNLDIAVPEDASGEIRELVEDFNSMVHHLRENRITLDENIREITFLKEYNETIIHSLRAGILVVDDELKIEKTNSFYRECFSGSAEAPEGRPLREAGPALLDEKIHSEARLIAGGRQKGWAGIRRDGETVWEVKLYPLGDTGNESSGRCVIELDDVSARTDLEQKILQAEKLSSLSLLSAGIAHEINNPLSTILSNAQLLISREKSGPERDSLEWIERETRRIAEIVRDLRDFSFADDNAESGHDINKCVEDVVRLVRYSVPADAGVTIDFIAHPTALPVAVPRDELRQVILNIMQNAAQSLNGEGSIVVETFKMDNSRQACIIRDTGSGISDDIKNRIFDPFFTTKPGREGTGLGLSIVYGIVKKFGGDIDVKSREGEGSVFTLSLPKGEDEL